MKTWRKKIMKKYKKIQLNFQQFSLQFSGFLNSLQSSIALFLLIRLLFHLLLCSNSNFVSSHEHTVKIIKLNQHIFYKGRTKFNAIPSESIFNWEGATKTACEVLWRQLWKIMKNSSKVGWRKLEGLKVSLRWEFAWTNARRLMSRRK